MYVLKNSLISIWRNKGRNILIAIIIMVISAACAVTLAIRNSAVKIVNAYEEKYEVEATIGIDRGNLMETIRGGNGSENKNTQQEMIETFNNLESLTVSEINDYGDSEYVKSYYYYYETSMNADDLEEATDSLVKETTTTETTEKKETFGEMPQGGRPGGEWGNKTTTSTTTTKIEKIFNEKAQNGAFSIVGYSSLESMTDFIDGKSTVTSGVIFTNFNAESEIDECIISEELADINELEVGDTITLVNPDNSKLTYELTISGIYAESSDTANNMTSMFTTSANKIIVPSYVVEKMLEDDEELSVTVTPTFILKNKDVLSDFKNEVTEKGLNEYYNVTDNVSQVEGATKSINNVKTFATTFLIITLIIGAVVLLVLNMINIRERKYEIGVLRTIGMKKITVISQFGLELLIVAVVGLMLGAAVGSVSSVKLANNLLENEISNVASDQENISNNFGNKNDLNENNPNDKGFDRNNIDFNQINGMMQIEQVDSINAVVDITVLLELLGIGLLLTIISSISACIAIARFSPLMILKERS